MAVDDKKDEVTLLNSYFYLFADGFFKVGPFPRKVTSRVDEGEGVGSPFGEVIVAVARTACFWGGDRLGAADHAVEEGGFADVGATYDGDDVADISGHKKCF